MKLGTLRDSSRDGTLVVVRRDNQVFTRAAEAAPTLQAALDDWERVSPLLRALSDRLERGEIAGEPVDTTRFAPPLPRAYEWVDGSAYINHILLVRKARGAEPPATLRTDPLVYQGGSGVLLGPTEDIVLRDPAWGLDFEAEVAVILGDVPQGTTREDAHRHVRLFMLVNDNTLRNLIPDELAKGFGFVQSKPASALSPVFVTPDTLGDRWRDGKLHGILNVDLNGQPFGRADAGEDMTFCFGTLIAHLAKTRSIGAGSIIGSGTVSNRGADGGPGQPVAKGGRGYNCIAEVRMVETIEGGAPVTPFLAPGNTVRIEMLDDRHHSIFGAIEQTVV